MGYYSLSINVSLAIAPMIGIWLMNEYGFHVMLIVSTLIMLVALPPSQWIAFVSVEKKAKSAHLLKGWNELFERSALFPSLLCLLVCVPFSGIMTYLVLFGREVGIANVGWFFLGSALMIVVTRPFFGKWFDRKGPTVVLLPSALFLILGMFLLSFAQSVTSLIISAMCYGIGYGGLQPSLQAWAVNRAAADRKGAANGTFLSAMDLGFGVGAMVLGAVAQQTGYAVMYRFSTLAMLLFLVIYGCYLFKESRRKSINKQPVFLEHHQ